MKNTLGKLWKFAKTPVQDIFSLDTVNSSLDGAKAIFEFAGKLKDEASNSQDIQKLVDRSSTLLDVLNSPWGQVISSSFPLVSIAVSLLKFYLEKTQEEPPLSHAVALVAQSAYLTSLQNYLTKQPELADKLKSNKKEASEVVKKEIDKLAELELTDYQARFALVDFSESELARAFNNILIDRLIETGIENLEAVMIATQISDDTHRYIEETLAEGAESIERIRKWYCLGGKDVFEKYLSIDTYLESQIATLPRQTVFDEEFTFKDIYVPLETVTLNANGEENNRSQSFILQDWVKEKILDEKYQDKVILIQAGPGRGKSVFCRMFAEQIRQELHPTLTPIFIRLRDIHTFKDNFEETLKSALNYDFVKNDNAWLNDRNTRYLFFLDGFDELRIEGRSKVGLDQFLKQIANFQEDMAKSPQEAGHRVILTGRTIAFQGISLPRNLVQVRIKAMDSTLQDKWLEKWQKVVDKNPIIAEQKTQEFKDFLRNQCPQEVKQELAVEPLLLYLLAAMHRDGSIESADFTDESQIQNKITIYQQSFDWVLNKQRDKFTQANIMGVKEEEFAEIMESTLTESALAVVQSGGESAQLKMIKNRIEKEDPGILQVLDNLLEKEGDKALNTALGAFYIKATDNGEGGVEFYHKSFSEFLFAKRLYFAFEKWIKKDPDSRRDRWFTKDEQLAKEVYDLLGYGGLSVEIVGYLGGLLQKSENFRFIDLFTRLKDFYFRWYDGEFMDADGTTHPQTKMRELKEFVFDRVNLGLTQVDVFTGLNVMILLFELHRYGKNSQDENLQKSLSFHPCGKLDRQNELPIINSSLLLNIINYSYSLRNQTFSDFVGKFIFNTNLSGVNLSGVNLSGVNLSNVNFTNTKLSGVNLSGADLTYTKLSSAKLSGADLSGADLSGAKLSGAKLSGADLSDTKLSGADLSGADLSGTDLSDTKLFGVNLSRANLTDTKLSGADLSDTDFTSADLIGAKLFRTDVTDANLTGANLTGANLTYADLTYADLTYADLSGVNLTYADLTYADLTGANFTGADFTGINLADVKNLTIRQLKSARNWQEAIYEK